MKKDIPTNDWLTKNIPKWKLLIEKKLSVLKAKIKLKRIERVGGYQPNDIDKPKPKPPTSGSNIIK